MLGHRSNQNICTFLRPLDLSSFGEHTSHLFQGQVSKIESTITRVNIILWNLFPPSIKPSDNASQWSDIGSMHFFLFLFILREIRVFLTDWPISRGRGKVGTADFFLHLFFFFLFLLSEEQWEIRGFLTDEWFFWGFLFRRNRWWFARPSPLPVPEME